MRFDLRAPAETKLQALLDKGVQVTSTRLPAASGRYALDPMTQQDIKNLADWVDKNGTFPNGQATLQYKDLTGQWRTWDKQACDDLLHALGIQLYQMRAKAAGDPAYPDWPSDSIAIP